ncbi:hypothetical protein CEUSTIGMA_g11419.t1 [Chlamydomonas eustigma]|uniref:DUF1279 domain-containing protein n=1 Tax=Chlamydomonas eustigma TaxID=1157962 RepID=A0A250XLP9_9CHLO|nr:hypothetical protein CEUSTIGMA_g11419.t1 [Chlamydomonas eustigma]|eukprot:GAX83994.1 hypothetical protein CEUSTIGMA_g11419.t1 [Chlamydomonas eustigma]
MLSIHQLSANKVRVSVRSEVSRRVCFSKRRLLGCAVSPKEEDKLSPSEATEKYGLEAGLFKVLSSKEEDGKVSKTDQAKQLLTQYGSAYLLTSITLALISFSLCYFAVNAGLDVASLLSKVGLQVNDTSETVGTFAIAYAAHKALSPVRFPPTVALTPVVAKWIGKKAGKDEK